MLEAEANQGLGWPASGEEANCVRDRAVMASYLAAATWHPQPCAQCRCAFSWYSGPPIPPTLAGPGLSFWASMNPTTQLSQESAGD